MESSLAVGSRQEFILGTMYLMQSLGGIQNQAWSFTIRNKASRVNANRSNTHYLHYMTILEELLTLEDQCLSLDLRHSTGTI